jgi:hypothetical protein
MKWVGYRDGISIISLINLRRCKRKSLRGLTREASMDSKIR